MLKKVAKKARAKQKKTKIGVQKAQGKAKDAKVDDAKVKEYGEKLRAWQDSTHKMLAANRLMELAGGYKQAFVLLDAVASAAAEKMKIGMWKRGDHVNNPKTKEYEYGENMGACEAMARQVLAAEKLIELAGGRMEAFSLLDAVMIAVEGEQGHEQASECHSSAAGHYKALEAAEEEAPV